MKSLDDMMPLVVIVPGALVALLLSFAALSWKRIRLPDAARLAAGMLAIYVVLLAALWLRCSSGTLLAIVVTAAIGSIAMQGDGLSRLTEVVGRLRLPLYLLSVATVAALTYVFVPITTYLTSPGELDIHLSYLVSINARDAMLVVYIAGALYMLAFTPRMRTLLALLALSALVLAVSYAYVLPLGYPPMSGLAFEQMPLAESTVRLRALLDAALVPAAVLAVCAALTRFGARSLIVGILLVNVSLGIATAVRIHGDDAKASGETQAEAAVSEQPLRFSPTQPNVLVIFLDRFMGSYVESILQSDPGLAERLSGFTWFPRSVAAGQNSIAGVHPMLGGYDYTPLEMNARKQSLRELSTEAFSILPYNFSKHGFAVNLVSPRGLGFTMNGDCSVLQIQRVNCTHIPMTVVRRRAEQMGFSLTDLAEANYADLLVLLGSMRSAPYVLKEVLYRRGPWQPFLNQSAGTTFREWAQLQGFAELSRIDAGERNFNFISSLLPHEPHYLGEDCQPRHELHLLPEEEVQQRGHGNQFSLNHANGARCTLLAVADYLDFLKSAGVYDNTKIVLVSDHGIVGPVEDTSTRAMAGGTSGRLYVSSRSMLLVKERNATGALQVSEAFMPNAEVPRIVCQEIGGCVNPFIDNKPIATDGRDDPFQVTFVPWQFSAQQPDAFVIELQLILRGKDPYDVKGWSVVK